MVATPRRAPTHRPRLSNAPCTATRPSHTSVPARMRCSTPALSGNPTRPVGTGSEQVAPVGGAVTPGRLADQPGRFGVGSPGAWRPPARGAQHSAEEACLAREAGADGAVVGRPVVRLTPGGRWPGGCASIARPGRRSAFPGSAMLHTGWTCVARQPGFGTSPTERGTCGESRSCRARSGIGALPRQVCVTVMGAGHGHASPSCRLHSLSNSCRSAQPSTTSTSETNSAPAASSRWTVRIAPGGR